VAFHTTISYNIYLLTHSFVQTLVVQLVDRVQSLCKQSGAERTTNVTTGYVIRGREYERMHSNRQVDERGRI